MSLFAMKTFDSALSNEDPKQQLLDEVRRGGVFDTAVLSALGRTPREAFVSAPFVTRSFENAALPIGCGQTISQPLVVGLMTQALNLSDRHKVLEVGTGSGYQSAVLARLCRRVYSIERHHLLLDEALIRFSQLDLRNIVAKEGDGYKGWPEQAPFDRILLTAAAKDIPRTLVEQLTIGGLMVLPVGRKENEQSVVRVRKFETHIQTETLFPVRFVPMVHGLPRGRHAEIQRQTPDALMRCPGTQSAL